MNTRATMWNLLVRPIIVMVLLSELVGCNQADLIQKFASPADQALARNYIDLLRQRQIDRIEKATDPSIADETLHGKLVQMADLIPTGEPTSVLLVGAYRTNVGESSTVNLTYEYGFSGRWILSNVAVKTQAGKTSIVGISVIPQPESLEEQHKFKLVDKTVTQYLVLALVIVLPLLTLFALVVCIRTRMNGRKWPWILFVICGFGKLAVNWTTGEWSFLPVAFQVASASVFAPLYGQWTLAVSLPLGAIIFLLRRRKLSVNA
jgi:hypothetical protein